LRNFKQLYKTGNYELPSNVRYVRDMNDKDLKGAVTLICEGGEDGHGDPQNHR